MNVLDRINEKLTKTVGIALAPVRGAVLGAAVYLSEAAQTVAVEVGTAAGEAAGAAATVAATPEGSAAIASAAGLPFLAPAIAALAVGIRRIKG